jgi:chaperonin GroES
MAIGTNVRTVELGDQVLFSPDDRYEVEVRGDDYIILRERDVHAVAAKRLEEGSTGLYL